MQMRRGRLLDERVVSSGGLQLRGDSSGASALTDNSATSLDPEALATHWAAHHMTV